MTSRVCEYLNIPLNNQLANLANTWSINPETSLIIKFRRFSKTIKLSGHQNASTLSLKEKKKQNLKKEISHEFPWKMTFTSLIITPSVSEKEIVSKVFPYFCIIITFSFIFCLDSSVWSRFGRILVFTKKKKKIKKLVLNRITSVSWKRSVYFHTSARVVKVPSPPRVKISRGP